MEIQIHPCPPYVPTKGDKLSLHMSDVGAVRNDDDSLTVIKSNKNQLTVGHTYTQKEFDAFCSLAQDEELLLVIHSLDKMNAAECSEHYNKMLQSRIEEMKKFLEEGD